MHMGINFKAFEAITIETFRPLGIAHLNQSSFSKLLCLKINSLDYLFAMAVLSKLDCSTETTIFQN